MAKKEDKKKTKSGEPAAAGLNPPKPWQKYNPDIKWPWPPEGTVISEENIQYPFPTGKKPE